LGRRGGLSRLPSALKLGRRLICFDQWLLFHGTSRHMLTAASTIGFLGMAGGFLGLIATQSLFSASPLVIVPQAGAVLLMAWARVTFGWRSFHLAANPTEGGLVTVGPYRYIRHPIYSGACLFTVAGAAAHGSWSAAALCGSVLGGAIVRLRCEEVLLAARYPQYADYAAKTWRMVPGMF
jgi:protein-S-isoprenylcysteine O-methyltransferase Ste14